ncbi:UNVERIFIED_CONTAM: hypothetical protein FKN15_013949 [Acipenser sinensis]
MTSQSHGIHHLIQAEKKAKEELDEAKKRKARRLKQAKDEALAEVENYRQMRENGFKNKQTGIMGSQGKFSLEVDEQTKNKIQTINSDFNQNKESVLKQLIDMACGIKAEIHGNYRG